MIEQLNIRPATNLDRFKIEGLVFGVLESYGLPFDRDGSDEDLADIESNYFGRGGVFEVIENDAGTIVGTVGLYPIDEITIELRKMYLDPSIRGRGLGKLILQKMILKAKSLGYARIYLDTSSALREAVFLYERIGFTPVAARETSGCDRAYAFELM